MLVRPLLARDPLAIAGEIEQLRSASDLYFQSGLAGLVAQHGRAVVDEAMRLHMRAMAAGRANVVPFVSKGRAL
jgi:hypothetical protein